MHAYQSCTRPRYSILSPAFFSICFNHFESFERKRSQLDNRGGCGVRHEWRDCVAVSTSFPSSSFHHIIIIIIRSIIIIGVQPFLVRASIQSKWRVDVTRERRMWGCISNSSSSSWRIWIMDLLSPLTRLNLWKDTTGHQMSVAVNAKFFMQSLPPHAAQRPVFPVNQPSKEIRIDWHVSWSVGRSVGCVRYCHGWFFLLLTWERNLLWPELSWMARGGQIQMVHEPTFFGRRVVLLVLRTWSDYAMRLMGLPYSRGIRFLFYQQQQHHESAPLSKSNSQEMRKTNRAINC